MVQVKTSELTGTALEWAVAKCEGAAEEWHNDAPFLWDGVPCIRINGRDMIYTPSADWSQGGPIIERERIAVQFGPHWTAVHNKRLCRPYYGHTPLIAAMRCYVASKLGNVVDIPDELIK